MATLLMQSSNNFTSSNWKTIDTTTASAFLNSEAGNTALTTSYVISSTFTPGTVTYEGVMVRVSSISNLPTGTISISLYNNTDATELAVVTCNITDLPMPTAAGGGWMYFKFGSPVTTTAAKAYVIRAKTSGTTQCNLYRDATAGNWSRALVTNAAGVAPAASDNLIIAGYVTAAATTTTIDCVMDNTASTVYGTLEVAAYSTFKLQNSASTAYLYNQSTSGNAYFTGNSVTEFGTVAAPIVSTSSFTITAGSAGSGASGNVWLIRSPASFTFQGTDTRGSRLTRAAADFSASATSITSSTSTGWLSGDLIAIGASARSATPATESKALSGNASGTTLSIAAVGTGKSGTAPTQVPLINLTSNAMMNGTSTTNTFCIQLTGLAPILKLGNVAFTNMGSGSALYRGISFLNTAYGSGLTVYIYRCSFYSCHTSVICIDTGSSNNLLGDLQFTENVSYLVNTLFTSTAGNSSPATWKVNDNTAIGSTGTSILCLDKGIEIKNNIVNGCTAATVNFNINMPAANTATIDNNAAECCNAQGFQVTLLNSTISNLTAWRCNTYGVNLLRCSESRINGIVIFGNTTAGILNNSVIWENLTLDSVVSNAGVTNTQPVGIASATLSSYTDVTIQNSSFGATTTHSTADFQCSSHQGKIVFNDSTLASTNQVSSQSLMSTSASVRIQRSGGVAGTNIGYWKAGKTTTDAVIFDTSPYSLRMTPSSATIKLIVPCGSFNVVSGSTAVITCKVRKSAAGDGATYNGNQIRWYLHANAAAGSSYDSDILMASSSAAANGAWETLSYTLPSAPTDNTAFTMYFDCDGSSGWVNVDTFTVT